MKYVEGFLAGVMFCVMVSTVLMGVTWIGSNTARGEIIDSCKEFGKFKHHRVWYECRPMEGE